MDGNYTQQELSDYLRSASEHVYGSPISQSASPAGAQAGEEAQLAANTQGGGALAFTGFDLALLTVGGVFLLALGALLRWASRERVARKLT